MKKKLLVAVLVLCSLILVLNASADPIPVRTFFLNSTGSSGDYGGTTVINADSGNFYMLYSLNTAEYGTLQGFCIEDVDSGSNQQYNAYSIFDAAALGLDTERMTKAAFLANTYLNTGDRAAAQLAIWNLVMDRDYSVSWSEGTVYAESQLVTRANQLLQLVDGVGENAGNTFGWLIAHNPTDNLSGDGLQDFLIKDPVPEPVSMLLFGTGLVGVGGYIRRRFKK